MKKSLTYAVVDLETTSTSLYSKSRIIQFSCYFVCDGKIVSNFTTLVNPKTTISNEVLALTGLDKKDIQKAPFFEDVAPSIYAILQGTIFVAHNIMFDYRFLSKELQRVGFPPLEIDGIDTIELSQIVFPTLKAYNLIDLAKELQIKNKHPHQADSDAKVTAELLIILLNKINSFPKKVLLTLTDLAQYLTYQTGDCFKRALKKSKETVISSNLVEVKGLVLKRFFYKTQELRHLDFPQNIEDKINWFKDVLEVRNEQVKLIDDVYHFFNSNKKEMVIQAPTGVGKSFGYLIPSLFYMMGEKKIIIATSTNALILQLENNVKFLEHIFKLNIDMTIVKGNSHYIDLQKFYNSLFQSQKESSRLLQMKIIVWLTETNSGDLDELNLPTMKGKLFQEIRHTGEKSLNCDSAFYDFDFIVRKKKELSTARLILTNQSYLLKNSSKFKNRVLIVDEAQNLPKEVIKNNHVTVDFDRIKIFSDTLLVKMQSKSSFSFTDLIDTNFLSKGQFNWLLKDIQKIDRNIDVVKVELLKEFNINKKADYFEIPVNVDNLLAFIERINPYFIEICKAQKHAKKIIEQLKEKVKNFSQEIDLEEAIFLKGYFKIFKKLNEHLDTLKEFEILKIKDQQKSLVFWIQYSSLENAHLRLNKDSFDGKNYLKKNLYANFKKVVFVGASLFTEKTKKFNLSQLDLSSKVFTKSYQNIFDYSKQAKVIIAKDALNVNDVSSSEYDMYIFNIIIKLTSKVRKQTLILFNSLDAIKKVYMRMKQEKNLINRKILAQGVSGGIEKIKRRFITDAKDAILLGTNTFLEGIDFPNEQLEVVIMVRLPFRTLSDPRVKAQHEKMRNQGKSPFYDYELPLAIMRLKQGFGRLIRTENDRGVFILLDSRICLELYGSDFYEAFPKNLPIHLENTQEIPKSVASFFR